MTCWKIPLGIFTIASLASKDVCQVFNTVHRAFSSFLETGGRVKTVCETWDFHSNEDSCHGLLGYYTLFWCGKIPKAAASILTYPENRGSMDGLQTIGILPHYYMVSW